MEFFSLGSPGALPDIAVAKTDGLDAWIHWALVLETRISPGLSVRPMIGLTRWGDINKR